MAAGESIWEVIVPKNPPTLVARSVSLRVAQHHGTIRYRKGPTIFSITWTFVGVFALAATYRIFAIELTLANAMASNISD